MQEERYQLPTQPFEDINSDDASVESESSLSALPGSVGYPLDATKGNGSGKKKRKSTGARRPKKAANKFVRDQFEVKEGSFENGGRFLCKHCQSRIFVWQTWNNTKATEHITKCEEVPNEVKVNARETSQAAKKQKRDVATTSFAEHVSPVRLKTKKQIKQETSNSKKRPESNNGETSKEMIKESTQPWRSSKMSRPTADKILKAHIEASLSRFEPPARIFDPIVKISLAASSGTGILPYIPDKDTVFTRFVEQIDVETEDFLVETLKKMPGTTTVSFCGVTVLGGSHVIYLVSKGSISVFAHMSQLGEDDVNVPDDEVEDAVRKIARLREKIGCSYSNAATDNAAFAVAEAVIEEYALQFPEEPPMLSTRDPSHYLDLFWEDSNKVGCMWDLIDDTKTVINFLNVDRVQEIIATAVKEKICARVPKVEVLSEIRFHGSADTFDMLLANRPFLDVVESLPEFQEYYRKQTPLEKKHIDDVITIVKGTLWNRLPYGVEWFKIVKIASKCISDESFPMSAYLPLIQATRNELNAVLNKTFGAIDFDTLFGPESREELVYFISSRFNMDGKGTPGRKVGLLDEYHIWAFLVDPYNRFLPHQLAICGGANNEGSMLFQIQNMLKFFVPGNEDSSKEIRTSMKQEWLKIRNQRQPYSYYWEDVGALPNELSYSEAQTDQKLLRIRQVVDWVEKHGAHDGRLDFFAAFMSTDYYKLVARPLLSIKTVRSIQCERAAKPLKNKVARKERNKLALEKREVLLRVGMNLRLKYATTKSLSSNVGGSSLSCDDEEDYDVF